MISFNNKFCFVFWFSVFYIESYVVWIDAILHTQKKRLQVFFL